MIDTFYRNLIKPFIPLWCILAGYNLGSYPSWHTVLGVLIFGFAGVAEVLRHFSRGES